MSRSCHSVGYWDGACRCQFRHLEERRQAAKEGKTYRTGKGITQLVHTLSLLSVLGKEGPAYASHAPRSSP
jgi:hypothetical protein